ncbi:hypothetical protein BDV34DRAFT_222323 [Aspergillus parasiticus]|uniref:Uncharacterized protein n=1 Tax=Aspergillus parasiticus TaxID=5067 RepID=A0A5N6DVM9_ASPPA|nr:hypothetical protein BDV34DRAFT_222323 [Aspergillus parasiticus]
MKVLGRGQVDRVTINKWKVALEVHDPRVFGWPPKNTRLSDAWVTMAEKEKKEKEKETQAEYEIERLSLTGLQAHILYHGLEKTHCLGPVTSTSTRLFTWRLGIVKGILTT